MGLGFFLGFVFALGIENYKAGKGIDRAGSPQQIVGSGTRASGLNINRGVIKSSRCHLAGDHSFPDELVKLELGVAQI